MFFLCAATIAALSFSLVNGHGYMIDPPGRSSAWRRGFSTPTNNDDNGLNCGGFYAQHELNHGLCGVCGDNFGVGERPNEPGPGNKYATGVIVANYTDGQTINVTTVLTAFHKGYFEFKLCDNINNTQQRGMDGTVAVTQRCFEQNVLESPSGDHRFNVPGGGRSTFTVKLPSTVTCDACVLQWRYRAGNNWGSEIIDGVMHAGLGFGPQEEFINCADIRIISSDGTTRSTHINTTVASTTGYTQTTASMPGTTDTPDYTNCFGLLDSFDIWCDNNCALGNCPEGICWCEGNPLPTVKDCQPRQPYPSNVTAFCNTNCNSVPPFCPVNECECVDTVIDPRQ